MQIDQRSCDSTSNTGRVVDKMKNRLLLAPASQEAMTIALCGAYLNFIPNAHYAAGERVVEWLD
jgi:hypothetical protein